MTSDHLLCFSEDLVCQLHMPIVIVLHTVRNKLISKLDKHFQSHQQPAMGTCQLKGSVDLVPCGTCPMRESPLRTVPHGLCVSVLYLSHV